MFFDAVRSGKFRLINGKLPVKHNVKHIITLTAATSFAWRGQHSKGVFYSRSWI